LWILKRFRWEDERKSLTENQLPADILPFALLSYLYLYFARKSSPTILSRAKFILRLSYCLKNGCLCDSCTNSKEAGAAYPKTAPPLPFLLAAAELNCLFPLAKWYCQVTLLLVCSKSVANIGHLYVCRWPQLISEVYSRLPLLAWDCFMSELQQSFVLFFRGFSLFFFFFFTWAFKTNISNLLQAKTLKSLQTQVFTSLFPWTVNIYFLFRDYTVLLPKLLAYLNCFFNQPSPLSIFQSPKNVLNSPHVSPIQNICLSW